VPMVETESWDGRSLQSVFKRSKTYETFSNSQTERRKQVANITQQLKYQTAQNINMKCIELLRQDMCMEIAVGIYK